MAHEYFPLTKEEALRRGYTRKDEEQKDYSTQTYSIQDHIADVADDIVDHVLQCEVSQKNYKIIPQELQFYRKMKLPIPRLHPDQRHLERMRKRTPRHLWERTCAKCGTAIKTTYAPDLSAGVERPEKIYCDECYNKAIY
ncbi:MAG: hypothetical protein WCG98_05385 [bacterium]